MTPHILTSLVVSGSLLLSAEAFAHSSSAHTKVHHGDHKAHGQSHKAHKQMRHHKAHYHKSKYRKRHCARKHCDYTHQHGHTYYAAHCDHHSHYSVTYHSHTQCKKVRKVRVHHGGVHLGFKRVCDNHYSDDGYYHHTRKPKVVATVQW